MRLSEMVTTSAARLFAVPAVSNAETGKVRCGDVRRLRLFDRFVECMVHCMAGMRVKPTYGNASFLCFWLLSTTLLLINPRISVTGQRGEHGKPQCHFLLEAPRYLIDHGDKARSASSPSLPYKPKCKSLVSKHTPSPGLGRRKWIEER